jgi:hypothetical protein
LGYLLTTLLSLVAEQVLLILERAAARVVLEHLLVEVH